MNILGISAFYHDSAAALTQNGEIIAAAQEERFTRKKHDERFPVHAIAYCLKESGLTINELDSIVFYDKPLLKFERLLETYYAFSPKGLRSFLMAMPIWMREKMFLRRVIHEELAKVESYDKKKVKLLFPEHHLSHAASAFYPSPFEEAAVLTIDGVGEWATASICHGKGKNLTILKELKFPHSLGLLYSAFTYFTGFKVNSGEYKLMGLAPYGNPTSPNLPKYIDAIKTKLVDIQEDGSIWLDQDYFDYATGLKMVNESKWAALFGFPTRKAESELAQHHCDLALAIQQVTEEIVLKMAAHAKKLTGAKHLCLAGGVALNCVSNGKLQKANIFEEVYIQPAAGDAGGALGAALAAQHIYFGKERTVSTQLDGMKGAYLGPEFSDIEVRQMAKKYKATYQFFENFEEIAAVTAQKLAEGNVIGWFQGKMEFGPRALGNRSILGDARNPEMQKKLNLKIKYREGFRPFAPSVLAENISDYFDYQGISPYMLLVHPVQHKIRKNLPKNYTALSVREKLYVLRSELPAITHIDFSARIQSVHRETNPRYWELIHQFQQLTGLALVVNTSFNVRGEPIVCTPEDAYKCLMRTEMDFLVIGNFLFDKTQQPKWEETDHWKTEFTLD
ncbi:MAG: carbamoyltransferase [Bacteroidia bacterium]